MTNLFCDNYLDIHRSRRAVQAQARQQLVPDHKKVSATSFPRSKRAPRSTVLVYTCLANNGGDISGVPIPSTRTVDVHVARLRQKLEPDQRDLKFIVTVHGLGELLSPSRT